MQLQRLRQKKVGWNLFSTTYGLVTVRMPHLQINDTLPPIGLAQDYIPLDALALCMPCLHPLAQPPPPLLRCLFWCLWHLSHDKHNETAELASQEKVVETGACCKVKRVFAKNKRGWEWGRGATTAVVRSFTRGRRVNCQGCRWSWREVPGS